MRNFPVVNNTAVTAAPIRTLFHRMKASGSVLKIIAKSAVLTKQERMKSVPCQSASLAVNGSFNHGLDRFSALTTDQLLDLIDHLVQCHLLTENQPRDRDGHNQNRSQ